MSKAFRLIAVTAAVAAGLSVTFLNTDPSYAAPRRVHTKAPRCNFLGVTALNRYLRHNEWKCFNSAAAATTAGYTALVLPARAKKSSHAFSCAVPAISTKTVHEYFSRKYSLCFGSEAAAKRAKYKHYVSPTATPSPTPTTGVGSVPTPNPGSGPTPTPTPVVDNSVPYVVNSFLLGPVQEGSNAQGTCSAQLIQLHITVDCTTNITDAGEAHLHVIPNNDPLCALSNPGTQWEISCDLTADQAAGIRAGNGLVAVHDTTGQEEAGGLIK